ncbi:hypothetical protein BME96_19020 (plasmid) [Virgibacillus halodenitrificans]|uniref:Thioester domain-containing protein n=1 Tax=Virgibacillus halodenitrificans TaxID=1482 RepID=A0AAC9J2I0_VIRHA|nr:hypothetical protein [Virgibacillus halodenitrificans]APC50376.1 hypothetical protein BME96_19020 [Virgibacillus halodenitrificans]
MKKFFVLLGVLFLTLSGAISASAADSVTNGRTVGGQYVSYSHFLSYMDVKCGMNTQAHYHADATNLDKMSVNWKVYDVMTGAVADQGGLSYSNRGTLRDSSRSYLAIERSNANYKFSNNGSSWTPGSNVYHCWNRSAAKANETSQSTDRDKLREMYYDLNQTSKSLQSNNDVTSEVKQILENQLKDNATDVTDFKFKNGNVVNFSDFKISNLAAANDKKIVADEVEFENPENSNATIIEVEIPESVYKDNKEYKLTGYVVFIASEEETIDSGLYLDLVK